MKLFLSLMLLVLANRSFAQSRLIVHTTEFGLAKFHRADNRLHAYGPKNAWTPYILPDSVTGIEKTITVKNADGSYTVFFSSLDQMMAAVVRISQKENRPVSVLNILAHGRPGSMRFPKDTESINGYGCRSWRELADGSDDSNVDDYYDPVTADQVREARQSSNMNSPTDLPCIVTLADWKVGVQKFPTFKSVFASDAQIHFLSCVLGLGLLGDSFTKGIAKLLLPNGAGSVETAVSFGLGDWSMSAGMGFWDYLSDAQIRHDNRVYPVEQKDAEIAQRGTIRRATFSEGAGGWTTSLLTNQSVMPLGFEF